MDDEPIKLSDGIWIKLDEYCRSVGCDKPSRVVVDTLNYGWIGLCDTHGVLMAAQENAITTNYR